MLAPSGLNPPRPSLQLAGAGGVLIGTTAACGIIGAVIGWAARHAAARPDGRARRRDPRRRLRGRTGATGRHYVRLAMFETPRPAPGRLLPAIAAAGLFALALPVFVVAGLAARRLGARRRALARRAGLRAAAGAARAWAPVTSRPRAWSGIRDDLSRDRRRWSCDRGRGVRRVARPRGGASCTRSPTRSSSALSLATYFGQEPPRVKRLLLARARSRSSLRGACVAEASSTRRTSSSCTTWIPIHLGPLDISINKAVVYLMLGALLTIVLGIVLMRVRARVDAGPPADDRRADLRHRADAGRRAGAARRRRSDAGSRTSRR